jgi:hypothetical protein
MKKLVVVAVCLISFVALAKSKKSVDRLPNQITGDFGKMMIKADGKNLFSIGKDKEILDKSALYTKFKKYSLLIQDREYTWLEIIENCKANVFSEAQCTSIYYSLNKLDFDIIVAQRDKKLGQNLSEYDNKLAEAGEDFRKILNSFQLELY